MKNLHLPLLLLLMFASTVNAASVVQAFFPHESCASTGNFTANSTYQTTLTTLVSSISTTKSLSLKYGFFNASAAVGDSSQTIYIIGSCNGDLTGESCRDCLNTAVSDIRHLCPLQKEAVLYSESCTIRYSNIPIVGVLTTQPCYPLSNRYNVTSEVTFKLGTLMESLWNEAAHGGSLRKYATRIESFGAVTIRVMAQCTPDLTEQQCIDCLGEIFKSDGQSFVGKQGMILFAPSCRFRYEIYPFFNPVGEPLPPSPPPPPPLRRPDGKGNSMRTVIIAFITSVSALLVVGVVMLWKLQRKKEPTQRIKGDVVEEISLAGGLQYDFGTIRAATDNFSSFKKLGQGGFGAVYKGRLVNGQEIAVKRLSQNSGQGEVEFKNEVMLLARLQHRNLVRLLGFCLERVERLLIYEFVPNSSLDLFLFDPLKGVNFDWSLRHKIIMGVARGLLYLHEDSRLRIIHRDLKASNILLDSDLEPKISDFGLARLFELDQTQAATSRIVGTYGYMAPEYVMHGNFSIKSDVFSFGVLVLEIVSGQRNNLLRVGNDMEILISYVWKNWREGTILNIIDPSITSGSSTEITRCIHIGLLCVQENLADRPTMASVILMLNSDLVTLQEPSQPAFFIHRGSELDMSSSQGGSSRTYEVDKSRGGSNQLSEKVVSMTEPCPR